MDFTGSAAVAAVMAVVGLSSGAVVLYQRSVAFELRLHIEQVKNTIIEQITNKNYVRREECPFREETVHSLLRLLRKDAKETVDL